MKSRHGRAGALVRGTPEINAVRSTKQISASIKTDLLLTPLLRHIPAILFLTWTFRLCAPTPRGSEAADHRRRRRADDVRARQVDVLSEPRSE
ncbi:hypothetical protein EVAR_60351_1 [Eumeta japonica]|uniref:Uncharacterized protein n=1 Tax=Eumeta variegata TaxID=151549 RepID=A0A4C1ZL41_EUMVA|nr:hypothetical protein EVAR_60351_1 [Eumeta japonica]